MKGIRKKNRYKRWFFLLLFFNLFYFGYQFIETPSLFHYLKNRIRYIFNNPIIPKGDYIYGIDISEYQGVVVWDKALEINEELPIDFVFIRATAGKDHRDRFFTSNWREASEMGVLKGAYHYFRPNENSLSQANNFINNVQLSPGDLPPVLDIERISKVQSINSLIIGIENWLNTVEKHYGVKPILYTGAHYYNDHLKDKFTDYTLWVANYNEVSVPINKDVWSIWQFSDNGSVKGIKGPVDLDLFQGSVDEMKKFALK